MEAVHEEGRNAKYRVFSMVPRKQTFTRCD